MSTDRYIRVFVSSTFSDMQAERDYLVKFTFPQLHKLCESRAVTWGEVDLRWGITEEEKAEGKVLPLCLEEIRRCRPYFIGLLGERYGWIPDEIPQELIERESWLKEHLGHSVTELEILHGVLLDPKMADHAYFYFRDPSFIDSLPPESRAPYAEVPTAEEISKHDEQEAQRRAEARKDKLAQLKDRIRRSRLPLRENYQQPDQLGQCVLEDFTRLINDLFPEGQQPDPLDREAADHEAFAQSRARVYIPRREYYARLDEHARGDGQPLVVLGESGCGKSALLANWALKYHKSHREELLLMHFIGATPYSADWAAMVRRIMGEFNRRFGIEQETPDQPDALRAAFANWLQMASARGNVVLILDALNQLEDRDNAPDLVWLPPVIPSNIRLIVSALPGRALDDLKKRGWPTMQVKPLEAAERRQLISEYLAQYAKALSPAHAERVAEADQTGNPLYLRTLLEELRLYGDHFTLEDRINYYLKAETIYDLYQKVLARWENDYEGDSDLVGDAMSLIWAARRGISEAELLDLLSSDNEPLPFANWLPLYLAAEGSLISRQGLYSFAHDYLRDAVRDAYVPAERHQNAVHIRLADYFEPREINSRKIDELSWQLAEAKSWQRLCDLLTDQQFFTAVWRVNQFEVKGYWAEIEAESPLRMVDAYAAVTETPATDISYTWSVGRLLDDTGHAEEAFSLQRYLVDQFRQTDDRENLQACLGNQALILSARGELEEAMRLHKEEERICRELRKKDGLQRSLGNQAVILQKEGELEEAMRLHKEEEGICRELGDRHGLSFSLGNQALILAKKGEFDEVARLLREEERICRELGNRDGLSRSFGNQAVVVRASGGLDDEAMRLYKAQERICRELGNKRGLQAYLGNQALILQNRGELDEAMRLYEEKERICRELRDKYELQVCLGDEALILQDRGELDEAMRLHKEEERICRELGNKDGLKASLGNQALILEARGELDEAMRLHQEEEGICRKLGDKRGLQACLGNQATVFLARGELDEAMRLLKEQERICRELGNKNGLQASLGNQAMILTHSGELGEAMRLVKEEEQICRELGNRDGLVTSLINQASLLAHKMGQPQKALPLAEEAYLLATQHGLLALARQIEPILNSIRSLLH
jgi:Domain of unknown function (DUF4062)/NACHT domain/MalT-like TPR region